MVNISKLDDSAIKFTFTNNDRYLYNGEITVPLNSLILVLDESDMAVLKKIDGDVFLTFLISNSNFSSKSDLEEWFKENACGSTGGGGVTSGEVETMIEASLEDYYDIDEVDTALANKADTSAVTAVDDALTAHTADTTVHVTSADKTAWNAKSDFSGSYNDLTDKPTIPTVPTSNTAFTNDAGYITSGDVTNQIEEATSGKADTTAFTAYSAATDARLAEDEEVTAAALNDLNAAVSGKADTSAVTAVANDVSTLSGAVEDAGAYYISFATIATTGIRDEDWDGIVAAIDGHRPIYAGYPRNDGGILYYGVECMNKNSGNTQIVLTASDNSQHYFYTFTKNGSNDYSYTVDTRPYTTQAEKAAWNTVSGKVETSAITSAITSASTNAEVAGAKAVYDAIQAGGGGGKEIVAGRGIEVTTGATADTVSFSLPISATTAGTNSIILFGSTKNTTNSDARSCLINGSYNTVRSYSNIILGSSNNFDTNSSNNLVKGQSNNLQGGNSSNTIVGNSNNLPMYGANGTIILGDENKLTSNGERRILIGKGLSALNTEEIATGKYNVSHYGSTNADKTAFSIGNGTADNARHNAFEIRQNGDIYLNDGTNDVKLQDYLQIKAVKITQAAYDALVTKDPNTLYIVTVD